LPSNKIMAVKESTRAGRDLESSTVTVQHDEEKQVVGSKPGMLQDTQDQSDVVSSKRKIVVFFALALALFVSFIDQTSVSTSMPAIGRDLDATSTIAWVSHASILVYLPAAKHHSSIQVGTSFLIANTAFQLVNGRLSDIFGRKACLMVCLGTLALGDLLCGFAKKSTELFVFRAIAGIGAGGINSLVMVIVSDLTSLRERGKFQGYLETFIALGNGMGPIVGGAFSEKATWRWSFWFVVPLSCVAMLVLLLLLPQPEVEAGWKGKILKIDFSGVVLSIAAILFLLVSHYTLILSSAIPSTRMISPPSYNSVLIPHLDPIKRRRQHLRMGLSACHFIPCVGCNTGDFVCHCRVEGSSHPRNAM
jgi:MFS family permease